MYPPAGAAYPESLVWVVCTSEVPASAPFEIFGMILLAMLAKAMVVAKMATPWLTDA